MEPDVNGLQPGAYLVIDQTCAPCSDAGHAIQDIAGDAFVVCGMSEPGVRAALGALGETSLDQPAILLVGSEGDLRLLRGVRLRAWIAKHLGLSDARRVRQIATSAASARWSAREGIARRGFLKRALLAGGAAVGLSSATSEGFASGTSTGSTSPAAELLPPDSPLVGALTRSAGWSEATEAFGQPDAASVTQTGVDGDAVLLTSIPGTGTFVVASPDANGRMTVLVMDPSRSDSDAEVLDWYLPSGQAVASQSFAQGGVTTTESTLGDRSTPRSCAIPTISLGNFRDCFVLCLTGGIEPDDDELDFLIPGCVEHCLKCGAFRSPPDCIFCYVCAGHRAIKCARYCARRHLLSCVP